MSQQDASSDGSITPSSTRSEDSPDWFVKGRDCHYLGHLEAIPVNFGGTLQQVFKAHIGYNATMWKVITCNDYGPRYNICYKLPRSGNNWIGQTAEDTRASDELFKLVRAREPKGSQYKYHIYYDSHVGVNVRTTESLIFESYLEGEDPGKVPEGPEMIPTLQERLGFGTHELV